ncbi:hypothetical protein DIPPA_61851 [Diplonema papillatum]|nr:hypothetical protein DIPPA_61851 [Diplonema papillatum]
MVHSSTSALLSPERPKAYVLRGLFRLWCEPRVLRVWGGATGWVSAEWQRTVLVKVQSVMYSEYITLGQHALCISTVG